jgi:arylsulfatase A-like enzyme
MKFLLSFFLLSFLCIAAERPNIICISVDDLNDWVGYLEGHPQAITPNFDKLSNKGIAFTNAHCTTPLCKPSRTAILTGLLPSKTGVYSNSAKFDFKKYTLLPQHFEKNGYITYGSGKIHHVKKNELFFKYSFNPGQRWSPFESKKVEYTT